MVLYSYLGRAAARFLKLLDKSRKEKMEIFGLAATLGASVITGTVAIVSAVLAARHAVRGQREQRIYESELTRRSALQERGEELYASIEQFGKNVFIAHLPLYSVMKGEMSYNDFLDHIAGLSFENKYDPNRQQLLVEVYFPELVVQYGTMQQKLRYHNKVVADHKNAYLNGEFEAPRFLEKFQSAQIAFEKELEVLKDMIAKEIRENLTLPTKAG